MGQLSQVQDFIEQSTRTRTKQSLSLLMEQITKEMGFDYYAIIHHVDIRAKEKDTALWLENYPRQWQRCS
jgi:LuxR family transcriptional regulator, quorum-sensing system regulator CciR